MPLIRFRVPYEVTIIGADAASGKPFSNILYYASVGSSGSPPAYGAAVAGTFQDSFLTGVQAKLAASLPTVTPSNWTTTAIRCRAIMGKGYSGPYLPIVTLASSGGVTLIITGTPHGLTSGQTVSLSGIFSPAAANGLWVVTVLSSSSFTIAVDTSTEAWSGDGSAQLAQGKLKFSYADSLEQVMILAGTVAGDALPNFSSCSFRRINPGTGRHWKSRISVSPIPEAQWVDGTMADGTFALWTAVGALMDDPVPAVDAGPATEQQTLYPIVISPQLAFAKPSPFVERSGWTQDLSSWSPRLNNGSMIRRKPRLTSSITVV